MFTQVHAADNFTSCIEWMLWAINSRNSKAKPSVGCSSEGGGGNCFEILIKSRIRQAFIDKV